MNLILFSPEELQHPVPADDPRARHILSVLRRQVGDAVDAGLINGPRGKATLAGITADGITLEFSATVPVSPPPPVTLLVGLPRPQTARDVLRDATTVGVGALHFVRMEKAEPSYAQSSLWTAGEWRRHVIAGAEQAFDTRVPDVTFGRTLAETLAAGAATFQTADRFALDNYESAVPLAEAPLTPGAPVVLAIGAERGWSAAERDLLRREGFRLVHLGTRVLRTETAVVAALTLVRAKLRLG